MPAFPVKPQHRSRRPRARARPGAGRVGALAAGIVAVLLTVACGGAPPPPPFGELPGIRDDQHRIANPGKLLATATGQNCAVLEAEALTSARRVAHFNLRSLTGRARYLVRFDIERRWREDGAFCVEVAATAVEPSPTATR